MTRDSAPCPICENPMTAGQRRVPFLVSEAHSSCAALRESDPTELRCVAHGCEKPARYLVGSVAANDALHDDPLRLCEDHIRRPDDVDIFRWLTKGRLSADPA